MSKVKIIYMSCEVQRRELNARLFFAAAAAARGYASVISQKLIMRMNMPNIPPGIFWHKTATSQCAHYFELGRKLGYRTVASCEEIINLADRPRTDDYARLYFDERAAGLVDLYLASTTLDSRLARKFPFRRVIDVGNVRIEQLRGDNRRVFAPAAEMLREKYGNFVLINSSFGLVGSLRPIEAERAEYDTLANRIPGARPDFFNEQYEREKKGIATVVNLSRQLQAQGRTVVVRPHPHENPEMWRHLLKDIPNVWVDDSGPVAPWLMAAEAVLQGNCTTGLESLLLERPVGNYMTEPDITLSAELIPPLGWEAALTQITHTHDGALAEMRNYVHGIDEPVVQQTLDAFDMLDAPEVDFTRLLGSRLKSVASFSNDPSMERRWPKMDYGDCKRVMRNAVEVLGIRNVGIVSPLPNIVIVAPLSAMQAVLTPAAAS